MKSVVLGFSGKIGTGKTTISSGVANVLGWPRVSFGDFIRSEAQRRGLEFTREALQSIGASLVDGNSERFCRSVLSQANWKPGQNLIVDGVRHAKIAYTLRQIVLPSDFSLVFITLNESVRRKRLATSELCYLTQIEANTTEVQVGTLLLELADLVVDGNSAVGVLVDEIAEWVRQQMN